MESIEVEVACALPDRQSVIRLSVPRGATVREAIERSGIRDRCPEVPVRDGYVGIFGRCCSLDEPLRAGDRVELYRPLVADPREARRKRAAKSR